jgi:hypothetical protein
MSDYVLCFTGPQDCQVEFPGQGHLAGVVVTSDSATPGACSLYDYAGGAPPTGPKIYDVIVNSAYQVTHLFNDRYAPRFKQGLWLHLSEHCYAILWAHFPKIT